MEVVARWYAGTEWKAWYAGRVVGTNPNGSFQVCYANATNTEFSWRTYVEKKDIRPRPGQH